MNDIKNIFCPNIVEERPLNMTIIDVYSRLMMDRIIFLSGEVNGDKMEWYYKSVGHDRDYQMRAYSPTRTNSEYVKVNIWNHSPENWSTPEWWENGVKVADMEVSKEYDLDYLNIYAEHNQQKLNKSQRAFSKPSKVPFMFKVKPSEGARSGEVRVTDNFGHTYTQSVEW